MKQSPRGRRSAGFSLLELVVVIVLVSMLLAIAIERLLLMKARAEATAMEQVVGTIRSAITIRMAELMSGGRSAELPGLVGSNPMLRLSETPQNYLGELFGPAPSALEPGNWYFDKRDHALCYLVESAEYFETTLRAPARTCFHLEAVFEDLNHNRRYDAGLDQLHGLRLAPSAPYAWRLQFLRPAWPWSAPKAAKGGRS